MSKLNIGCGNQIWEGWINLDQQTTDPGVNVQSNIMEGLPFKDNTIDEIYCSNVLEHIPTGEPSVEIINEMYRVCKPNAYAVIVVPHAKSQGAFQDPFHCSFFVPRRALYWRLDNKYATLVGNKADFCVLSIDETGDMDTEAYIIYKLRAEKM